MKKIRTILFILIILNFFNQNIEAIGFANQSGNNRNRSVLKSEYIDFRSAKINGKIPFLTKTTLLFKLAGRPEKLINPDLNDYCGSFYNKIFKLATIKGVDAEIYGDVAVVRSINFQKSMGLSLITPLISLNYRTKLDDLKRIFPKEVKSGTVINDTELGKTIGVNIKSSAQETENSWLLLFKNGKLIRIDYNIPC